MSHKVQNAGNAEIAGRTSISPKFRSLSHVFNYVIKFVVLLITLLCLQTGIFTYCRIPACAKNGEEQSVQRKKINVERREYLAWSYKAIDSCELVQMLTKYSNRACKKK